MPEVHAAEQGRVAGEYTSLLTRCGFNTVPVPCRSAPAPPEGAMIFALPPPGVREVEGSDSLIYHHFYREVQFFREKRL